MYTHDRRVTYSEISMKGFADIAQIAEYFQDCSVFQSEVLGMGLTYMNEHHLAWLLASSVSAHGHTNSMQLSVTETLCFRTRTADVSLLPIRSGYLWIWKTDTL